MKDHTDDTAPERELPVADRDEDPIGDDLLDVTGDDADAPEDTGRPADDEVTS